MCLAIPALIVEKEGSQAKADVGGVVREISLELIDRPADVGDYVLLHAGFAIHKLEKEEAEETLKLMRDVLG
ncbi:HypC/HybG/HupF family hydrogenase formation chaperone [Candidatus Eisenbacteria bacterium]|uniref:HypC/HybG/HupF family hydrogenase formation chaperone n=1 Tax=Eiseniibacteriota bacterium TaxID=2212470 RepID=A0ABV6YNZ7_UNCEI